MSYIYEQREQLPEAWNAYRNAVRHAPSPTHLLFAHLSGDVFEHGLYHEEGGKEMLETAVRARADMGIVAAMAVERLAGLAKRRGTITQATEWYQRLGAVKQWRVIGPFSNVSGSGYDKAYPPETEDVPLAVYSGESSAEVRWIDLTVTRRDGWIDMRQYFASIDGVFYASTYVFSPTERRVHARIGTSGAFKLLVNDSLIHASVDEHNNDLDTYISAMTLPKGWSHVLVKLGSYDIDRCNFLFRFTDESGALLSDIEYSTQPRPTQRTDLRVERIDNPVLTALRLAVDTAAIAVVPAILLAKCHLRNDQAIEAELVLRPFVRRYPTSVLLLRLYQEALLRGAKFDEARSTMEVMKQQRPDLPFAIRSRLAEANEQENYDESARLLKTLEQALPGSVDYYQAAVTLASKTNDMIALRELVRKGFEAHPDNIVMASAAARLSTLGTRRYDSAIAIMQRHMKLNYSESALATLAEFYKQAGNDRAWEATFMALLELVPAAPGYYAAMADYRASRSEFDQAVALLRKALEISPTSSTLWKDLGDIYRTRRDIAQAQTCYESALRYDPADFDVREALRQVRGVPSPFALMPLANIDSILTREANRAYSDDDASADAITLYSSKQRVVYDGSRCEVRQETLILITSVDGIDDYKEYTVWRGNRNALTFEKSVVRKPNGREIPADRDGGFLVFKTLEVGDVIHVRYRVREANYGLLAQYMVDDVTFDDDIPVRHASYHLIIPEQQRVTWRASNWDVTPTTSSTVYGTQYVWTLTDAPAIQPEIDMPSFGDVAKRVRLSMIPSWQDVIQWYHSVSHTKARSTFEITEVMDSLVPRGATMPESEIIQRVYQYITTNVRYSAVSFRQSGIIPQYGRKTLITRIGDCKDVATLCIAMLAERNIRAHIVLVNTELSPNAPDPLPTTDFDHAIVRIMARSGPIYMDLTAPDIPVGCLPAGDVGAFALHIEPSATAPVRLRRTMFPPSNVTATVHMQLAGDSVVLANAFTHYGGRSAYYRGPWKKQSDNDVTKSLRESLSYDYPDVEVTNLRRSGFDTLAGSIEYGYTAVAPRHVIVAGAFRIVKIPWYGDYLPDQALSHQQRRFAIEREPRIDTIREHITIDIPEGYEPYGIERLFERRHPAADVRVTSSIDNNVLHITRVGVQRSAVITPDAYLAYRSYYNDVVDHDRRYLLFVPRGTKVSAGTASPRTSSPTKKR